MNGCPEVAVLQASAWDAPTRSHVAQCGSCRIVVELVEERAQAAVSRERRLECARFEGLIAIRIGGQLGGPAAGLLDAHLATCEDCGAIAESLAPANDAAPDQRLLPAVDSRAYAIGGEIGRGGMGRILAARDLRIGRPVAVKELLAKTSSQAARFEREARVTARLQHPGIVPIYEIGRWDNGTPFYSMRIVKGRTLRVALRDSTTLAARLALLPSVIAATEAVAFAHANQIVHRDLTPANIMVGEYGETVVIDWGLAKDLSSDVEEDDDIGPYRRAPAAESGLTAVGAVIGTASYMPPEQALGSAVDARADVYALGAILYHLLAGRPPYRGGNTDEVLGQVKQGPPPPIGEPAPPDLISIVDKAMAREPADRYASARELAVELTAFQAGRLVESHVYTRGELLGRWMRRNTRALVVAAVAGLVLVGFGGLAVRRIIGERDAAERERAVAETQRLAAETERAESRRMNNALLFDQGRQELQGGHPLRALPYLSAAYSGGDTSTDIRRLIAAAMRPLDSHERSLVGEPSNVEGIAFRRDGTRLAVVHRNVIEIWDPAAGTVVARLRQPAFDGAVFSPDGAALLTWNGHDGQVWDAESGALRFAIACPKWPSTERRCGFDDGYFASDARIVTVAYHGGWQVWDAVTGALLRTIPPQGGHWHSAISTDGRRLVTWQNATVKFTVWDTETGARVASIDPEAFVGRIALSDDGSRAASCGPDGIVRVWHTATGTLVTRLAGHQAIVWTCTFDRTGTRLLTTSDDGYARVWSLRSSSPITTVGHTTVGLRGTFARDGLRFITGGEGIGSGGVRIWDADTGTLLGSYESSSGVLESDDGTRLATYRDHAVQLWRSRVAIEARFVAPKLTIDSVNRAASRLITVNGDCGSVASVAYQPNETGRLCEVVTLRDLATGARLDHPAIQTPAAFSGDGLHLFGVSPAGAVIVLDAETGRLTHTLDTTGERRPHRVKPSFDGTRVLVEVPVAFPQLGIGGWRPTLWDVRAGTRITTVDATVGGSALDRDGHRLLAYVDDPGGKHAGKPRTLGIWDLDRNERIATVETSVNSFYQEACLFVPDGSGDVLVFEGWQGELDKLRVVWFDANGKRVAELPLLATLDFDAAARTLATAGIDGTIRVWDVRTRAVISSFFVTDEEVLVGIAVNGDGTTAAIARPDGTIELRSLRDGRLLLALATRSHDVIADGDNVTWNNTGLRFTTDGESLVIAGKSLVRWSIATDRRSAEEIAKIVAERVPWRLEVDGRLVRRDP